MEEVFIRKYSLTIGRASELIKKTESPSVITPGGEESTPSATGVRGTLTDGSYEDFLTTPNGAITITDLRITADIVDSKEGTSNKNAATIEVFNLTDANQKLIRSDDTILLKAGYEIDGEELPLVYAGQVTTVTTITKGQDTVTRMVCKASEVGRKNIRISKVPTRNETSETIANYFAGIAAKNGIPTGNVFVPIALDYPSGYAAAGNLFDIMEEFCSNTALKSYVTLGKLYIEPQDSTETVALVTVDEENIKGSLKPQDDSAGKTSKDSKQGLEFSLFLDGRITVAKVVKINFGEFKGDYNVTSVNFKMDSEGSHWDTIISCIRR